MTALLLLMPPAFGMSLIGLGAFLLAPRNDQFEDPKGNARRILAPRNHRKRKDRTMTTWLPTLRTNTPEEGYDLAVKLARVAIKMTQPDAEVRIKLRSVYAEDADSLIASSQVVATHFATVAAANGYWMDRA